MKQLVAFAMVIALVSCSSKPKEEQTTVSTVPPAPTEPATAGENISSAAAAGAGSTADTAGAAVAGAGSAVDQAGSTAAAGASTAKTQVGSAAASAAPASTFDFAKLTHEEKMDFMKKQVVPTMKPLFQAFDKKEFANFGCKTCHGKDPVKAKYKMPNAGLAKLDFAKLKEGKQSPKAAEWMGKVVKPTMAKLFQRPEYSEENPTGFGCLHCHEEKK